VSIDYVEMTGVYSKIQELYKKTTQDNITHRFLHPVADPTYVYRYLWGRGCRSFFIYYNNKPVGVVDVTPCGDGAEVAILIIDAYQGRGLGKAVAYDFAGRLKKMGFRYVLAYVSPENYKALAIARKIGAEIKCRDVCVVKYVLAEGGEEMCRR
jgi:Acetyltransferase (GNAT) family.